MNRIHKLPVRASNAKSFLEKKTATSFFPLSGATLQSQLQPQAVSATSAVPAATARPDVVYIMGKDNPKSGNIFYKAATDFFKARLPKAVFATPDSLEGLFAHLNSTFTSPLGNIFIVSHANEDGTLAFPLKSGDKDKHLSPVQLRNALHPGAGAASTLTDVSSLVDAQTHIKIKGCDLGRNQQMVELIDEAFGGSGQVTAPTHEQAYSENAGEIKAGKDKAMSEHLDQFQRSLPALPPVPPPVPKGLRGDALKKAKADFAAAKKLRADAEAQRKKLIAAEKASFAPEAARLGAIAGTHDALSGPMFQRPGTTLFTAKELQPQVDALYPHLSAKQRAGLVTALVKRDARKEATALKQGVFQQSGQRAYKYSNKFTFVAPQDFGQAKRAFAAMFKKNNFQAISMTSIRPTTVGSTTVFKYEFEGHDTRRGHKTDAMTFTASSAPIDADNDLIAKVQAAINNPDKFNWRVEKKQGADGTLTVNVIRERVVAYIHHGSLNASSRDYFSPPESDRRFFAASP